MSNPRPVSIDFEFVIPEPRWLDKAKARLNSTSEDERCIAKAIVDATAVTERTKDAIAAGQVTDLADYFDHWMGDAIEAANRLLSSPEPDTRNLAKLLIAQSEAMAHSKEAFLKEAKRVHGP